MWEFPGTGAQVCITKGTKGELRIIFYVLQYDCNNPRLLFGLEYQMFLYKITDERI